MIRSDKKKDPFIRRMTFSQERSHSRSIERRLIKDRRLAFCPPSFSSLPSLFLSFFHSLILYFPPLSFSHSASFSSLPSICQPSSLLLPSQTCLGLMVVHAIFLWKDNIKERLDFESRISLVFAPDKVIAIWVDKLSLCAWSMGHERLFHEISIFKFWCLVTVFKAALFFSIW